MEEIKTKFLISITFYVLTIATLFSSNVCCSLGKKFIEVINKNYVVEFNKLIRAPNQSMPDELGRNVLLTYVYGISTL